jgi:hypothetical protein
LSGCFVVYKLGTREWSIQNENETLSHGDSIKRTHDSHNRDRVLGTPVDFFLDIQPGSSLSFRPLEQPEIS